MDGKLPCKGTAPVNPQLHDEFVTLVALFYSGELTDEEWSLLQVHLAYCASCRSTFEQYEHIASNVIPAIAASAAAEIDNLPRESERAIAEAEQRLMGKLGQMPGSAGQPAIQKPTWRIAAGTLAACALVAVVFASLRVARQKAQTPTSSSQSVPAIPSASIVSGSDERLRRALEGSEQQVTELQQQLAAAKERAAQTTWSDLALQRKLDSDRVQEEQLTSEKDALSQQLAAAVADVQSLRDKATSTAANADQQSERATSLEAKVHTLNAALDVANTALNDKDRILALDKDFLAHDKDIRDLIGARNLYIADIFDTNEKGKTEKPFGRIFYTKDRSLVFYGFDLEKQAGLRQTVAFQAWGSGSDKGPTSLGLFYQDDSHKRWVLRCDDAKSLARMDMVFVTVEPPGGSAKPTGKLLLRAYLQIQPNHL